VRYFFTGRQLPVNAILLVESGSRGLLEGLIPSLRQTWGGDIPIDLVTCYSSLPQGFNPETTSVYRVADYRAAKAAANSTANSPKRTIPWWGSSAPKSPS
jgi:hypothetical protein